MTSSSPSLQVPKAKPRRLLSPARIRQATLVLSDRKLAQPLPEDEDDDDLVHEVAGQSTDENDAIDKQIFLDSLLGSDAQLMRGVLSSPSHPYSGLLKSKGHTSVSGLRAVSFEGVTALLEQYYSSHPAARSSYQQGMWPLSLLVLAAAGDNTPLAMRVLTKLHMLSAGSLMGALAHEEHILALVALVSARRPQLVALLNSPSCSLDVVDALHIGRTWSAVWGAGLLPPRAVLCLLDLALIGEERDTTPLYALWTASLLNTKVAQLQRPNPNGSDAVNLLEASFAASFTGG